MKNPVFYSLHPILKLILALCFWLFFTGIFGLIGASIADVMYGVSYAEIVKADWSDADTVNGMRVIAFFAQLGGFLIASLVFAKLTSFKLSDYFHFRKGVGWKMIGVLALLYVVSFPAINFLSYVNSLLEMDAGSWMNEAHDSSMQQKSAILSGSGITDVLFNLLVLAVLPAIGEELFFRGIVLRYCHQLTKRLHVAVILSSVLFSLAHFEYLNFLPIFFMGLVLGYIYVYSGSIWWGVLFHFINNGMIVLVSYFVQGYELEQADDLTNYGNDGAGLIIGVFGLLVLAYLLYRSINNGKWTEMNGSLLRD